MKINRKFMAILVASLLCSTQLHTMQLGPYPGMMMPGSALAHWYGEGSMPNSPLLAGAYCRIQTQIPQGHERSWGNLSMGLWPSQQQKGTDCGWYALANALAINGLCESDQNITPEGVQRAHQRILGFLQGLTVRTRYQDGLLSHRDLAKIATAFQGCSSGIPSNNLYCMQYSTRRNGLAVSCGSLTNPALPERLAQDVGQGYVFLTTSEGQRAMQSAKQKLQTQGAVHFLLKSNTWYGDHWQLISAFKKDNDGECRVVLLDSGNPGAIVPGTTTASAMEQIAHSLQGADRAALTV